MANGGNPFVIDRLNEVREQNKDLYDQGKFDLLFDKFNLVIIYGFFFNRCVFKYMVLDAISYRLVNFDR